MNLSDYKILAVELNGHNYWWYSAYYDDSWSENSVFRIDHYPYKNKTDLHFV